MATLQKPAKAKGAQRVIEVLDFFDEQHRHATVMDIARRYDRPQSSTSELLASLVKLGLLYKDPGSRSYTLTPRAAILGSLSQPRMVRDGRLAALIDELRAQTGLGVVLVGMVGPHAQLFRWKPGLQRLGGASAGFIGGAHETLCETAAGTILMTTLPPTRRDGMLRRLNAEAPEARKFVPVELSAQIQEAGRRGFAIGRSGFGVDAGLAAILLPIEGDERPMAIGFAFDPVEERDPARLVAILQACTRRFTDEDARNAIANAA